MKKRVVADPEELISGPDVAGIWRVDPATVRRWRKKEGAPCHIIGNGLVRYKLSELEKWRASRPIRSVPKPPTQKVEPAVKEGAK